LQVHNVSLVESTSWSPFAAILHSQKRPEFRLSLAPYLELRHRLADLITITIELVIGARHDHGLVSIALGPMCIREGSYNDLVPSGVKCSCLPALVTSPLTLFLYIKNSVTEKKEETRIFRPP
jgi:hypothetical protein